MAKKGHIPWNKGLKGSQVAWNKGLKSVQVPWNKGLNKSDKRIVSGNNHHAYLGELAHDRNYRNKVSREWRKNNPLKVKTSNHKRRIKIKSINFETIQYVYETNIKKYGTLTCYLCLNPIPFGARQDHLEHKIPLSRGGDNEKENLDIACQNCNCSKNNKTEQEFREYQKRRSLCPS